MQVEVIEAVLRQRDNGFGGVALACARFVDPIPNTSALKRTPLHRRQIDLARKFAVDENAESVARTQLPFPLARVAADRERLSVLNDIRSTRRPSWLPFCEPLTISSSDFTPSRKISRHKRTKQYSTSEQGGHKGRS
jgi:hypothetical protein